MSNIMNLYMDDSGTRHPDHKVGKKPLHGHDYFALGGVLIKESDEVYARALYNSFCSKWNINGLETPLHSTEIRGKNKNFAWLGKLTERDQQSFLEDLYQFMSQSPVIGIACVIDRPCYDARYRELYGRNLWSLCQTSFSICTERALKYALLQNHKLRVLVERSDKKVDYTLKNYYQNLQNIGMPFSQRMSDFSPLTKECFSQNLHEFRPKAKSSPLIQLADLYLWPMAMGGYNNNNRPYARLIRDQKLIDCHLPEEQIFHEGIKYSCFDF